MNASIADVARLANVSISTVSRVINRRAVVSEETRARVESAIRELGYQPNPFARGLMLRRSHMIGLVLPDLHGEFYSEIIRGANQKARELGYHLILSSMSDGEDTCGLLEDISRRSLADGIALMVSEMTTGIQQLLASFRTPLVLLDDQTDDGSHDSVVIDQFGGAEALVRHLLERHDARRVIFVGGLPTNFDSEARLDAARSVLDAAGHALSDDDVFHLDYRYDTAYTLAVEHARDWSGPGNFVFAANDEMACGIIDATIALGLSVPGDVAVVGFDDIRVARMTRPALTTVRVPMARMAELAVELLCRRLDNGTIPPAHLSLRPELAIRASCGCLAPA